MIMCPAGTASIASELYSFGRRIHAYAALAWIPLRLGHAQIVFVTAQWIDSGLAVGTARSNQSHNLLSHSK
jgi:hypothetical protein